MTEQDKTPVTVLGLGPMGSALAGAFLDSGHPTTVWNRTPAKADALVARGAGAAGRAADAVGASRLVVVSVIDYEAVHAIVGPLARNLRGRTLVNLTADTPERARRAAAWAAEHGIEYLDGSVMTPAATVGRVEASFLFSGPEAVWEAHRATLADLGGTATYLGPDPGKAAAFDVALLDIFWTSMSGAVHAFALARAEGIAARELVPFALGILDVAAAVTADLAAEVDDGRYPGDDSTLRSAAAGMAHIIAAARARGLDTSVLSAAKALADRAIESGHGTDGFSSVVEAVTRP